MELNLYGLPDDPVHVSCFNGEYGGAVELNTVFLVDAVLSYGRLVRVFQTDVAFVFFQSGVDGAASLPNHSHSYRRGNLKSYNTVTVKRVINIWS
jgi:hypothetical protein